MSLNVLVVDDSAVMRAMLIKILRLCGVPLREVYQAGDGEEGLKLLARHWIDLALIDINMPVMSGEEMIDQVRSNPETAALPIIVVSTEGSESRIQNLTQKGARFVHKPFTPDKLREAIKGMTGVSDEELSGDGTLQGSGRDF